MPGCCCLRCRFSLSSVTASSVAKSAISKPSSGRRISHTSDASAGGYKSRGSAKPPRRRWTHIFRLIELPLQLSNGGVDQALAPRRVGLALEQLLGGGNGHV